MDDKKVSFGFKKLQKKAPLVVKKEPPKSAAKEFIKCLEGHEIKLLQDKPKQTALIIPLKESHRTSTALASLMKRRAVLLDEEDPKIEVNCRADKVPIRESDEQKTESLEERAAREILEATKEKTDAPVSNLVLPVVRADDLPLDGAQESTLDDYERIPVTEFGKAMLRGMGWVDPPPENINNNAKYDTIVNIRPRGMGLGADKVLKPKPLLVPPEPNEILEIKRNAFVRIIGGKFKDSYGQIEDFDSYAGRVIVKMALGNNKQSFDDFLCNPVTSREYAQYSKCINNAKYEAYKRKEKTVKEKNCNGMAEQKFIDVKIKQEDNNSKVYKVIGKYEKRDSEKNVIERSSLSSDRDDYKYRHERHSGKFESDDCKLKHSNEKECKKSDRDKEMKASYRKKPLPSESDSDVEYKERRHGKTDKSKMQQYQKSKGRQKEDTRSTEEFSDSSEDETYRRKHKKSKKSKKQRECSRSSRRS